MSHIPAVHHTSSVRLVFYLSSPVASIRQPVQNSNQMNFDSSMTQAPQATPNQAAEPLYVIVFGYPPDKYSVAVEYFKQLGETTDPDPNTEISNCFKIGFKNPAEAMWAVRKNGEIVGGSWMVGVKWAVRHLLSFPLSTEMEPNPFLFHSRISVRQIVSSVKQRHALHTHLCLMSARRSISCQPTRLGLPARLTSSPYPLPVHRITTPRRWVPQSDSPHPRLRSGSRGRHREQRRVRQGRSSRRSLRR
jgi:Nup53/35/40-type RNA recognition motif